MQNVSDCEGSYCGLRSGLHGYGKRLSGACLLGLAACGTHDGRSDTLAANPQQPAPDRSALRTLTNFADGEVALRWNSVNDPVMGGRSSGSFRIGGGILLFEGVLNTRGGGFASLRTEPAELALAGHSKVIIRVRGDGRTYSFRVGTGDSAVSYRADFEPPRDQWAEIELPLAGFVPSRRGRALDRPPIEPGAIRQLGVLLADGRDGPFRLQMDWIKVQ